MLVVVVVAGLLPAAAWARPQGEGEGEDADETKVRAARPTDIDDVRVDLSRAPWGMAPEDALAAAAGTSLVHDGGPLAPSRVFVRGLSGARLDADVAGLPLTDPATGLLDTAGLPWAALRSAVVKSGVTGGSAGALRLQPDTRAGARARFLVGEAGTARASLGAADGNHALAADVGLSRGDFTYVPTSSVGEAAAAPARRQNNDHRRATVLGTTHTPLGDAVARVVAFGSVHEGGIPGLAARPTQGLRGSDGAVGARAALEVPLHDPRRATSSAAADGATSGARLTVVIDGRAAHRATWGPRDARSAIESLAAGISADVAGMPLAQARFDVGLRLGATTLLDGRFDRAAATARAAATIPLGILRARGDVDLRLYSDVGALLGGGARLEAGRDLRASFGVARAARAPTLDELYAPRGLVVGNPTLEPETFNDVEAAVAFVPGEIIDVRVVGFMGFMEDGIAWVNRNAYEVAPVNLGPGRRAGVETTARVVPHRLLGVDLAAAWLWSHVDATAAPLPLAPPWTSRLAVRVGEEDGTHLAAVVRARGAAASNLFGTLVAPAYTLVDLHARLPIPRGLALGFTVANLLDVLDARDANQLPLPGRLVFLSLEVET